MEHLSITFPEELRKELDREAEREHTKRSTLIQRAVRFYLALKRKRKETELLKEAYAELGDESRRVMRKFSNQDGR